MAFHNFCFEAAALRFFNPASYIHLTFHQTYQACRGEPQSQEVSFMEIHLREVRLGKIPYTLQEKPPKKGR